MSNSFWSWFIVIVLLLSGWQYVEEKDDKINSLKADNIKLKADYNNLVDEVNKRIKDATDDYNKLVDETNKKLASANRPEATVIVNFRKGFVDNGDVAIFTNISGRTTVITAEIERPSSGKTKTIDLAFDRGTTRNIGETEGWAFLSGDTVTIHQEGHKSLTFANR